MGLNETKHPIEQKILLLILTLCLTPPLLFVYLAVKGSRLTHEETVGVELEEDAVQIATAFDRFMKRRLGRMRALARHSGREMTWGEMKETVGEEGLSQAVMAWGADWRVNVEPVPGAGRSAAPEGAAEAVDAWLEESGWRPGDESIFDLKLKTPEGRDETYLGLVFSDPSGGLIGFLDPVSRLMTEFREQERLVLNPILVRSKRLGVIYWFAGDWRGDEQLEVPGDEDKRRWFSTELGGRPYLLGRAASQRTAWLMGSNKPTGTVWEFLPAYEMDGYLAVQQRLIWQAALIAIGLVIVLMFLAKALARHVVLPMQELREQAERLARGDLDVRVNVTSHDEMADLADSFNSMADRLRTTYGALEQRLGQNRVHANHIAVLNEITQAIIQVRQVGNIFEILGRELGKIIPHDMLCLGMIDPERGIMFVTYVEPTWVMGLLPEGWVPLEGVAAWASGGAGPDGECAAGGRSGGFRERGFRGRGVPQCDDHAAAGRRGAWWGF